MLEQLLEDVDQHGALGLGVGHRVVGIAPHAGRRGHRVEPHHVLAQAAAGLLGAPQQARHVPLRRELGGPVALDRALGDRGAAPVLHDAEAVGQDGVGGVGVAERGRRLARSSPSSSTMAAICAQRQVDEPQVVRRPTTATVRALAVSGRPRHRGR